MQISIFRLALCALLGAGGPLAAATLDFDTLGTGAASAAGNIEGTEFAAFGVLISSNRQLALFDSNCGPDGTNTCRTTRTDSDLATGPSFGSAPENRILILNGGTDAAPNDDRRGGRFTFDFATAVRFDSLRLIDIDERGLFNNLTFRFRLGDGATRVYAGNDDLSALATLVNSGFAGDNSVRDLRFGLDNVTRLDLDFRNVSGAVGSLSYIAPIPLAPALPLLATGLAGLALLRRAATRPAV